MRNSILYLGLIISLIGCSSNQQQIDLLFKRGNREAAAGNYRKALAIYRQIDHRGIERAELYCNMGNACLKLERPGLARYYYEHGLQLTPWDPQLISNRRLVLEQLGINLSSPVTIKTPVFQRIADSLIQFAISSLFLGTLVLGFYVYGGNKRYSGQLHILANTLLTSGAGIVVIILFLRLCFIQDTAIVVSHGTALRMGPSEASRKIAEIKEGQKLLVTNHYRGWIKVSGPVAQQGWIKLSSAARLPQQEVLEL